jgi:TRAP transporter TAXI family solute receptor
MKRFFILTFTVFLVVSMVGVVQAGKWDNLVMGTSSTGGTWYPLGGGIAAVITKYVEGVRGSAIPSGASIENARAVSKGRQHLALVMPEIGYYAYNGMKMFEKEKLDKLRGFFSAHGSDIQFYVPANSPIKSVFDLKGKNYRVAVGHAGSGTNVMARFILGVYGITYDDIREQFLSATETTQAMKDGNIDMGIITMGTPGPTIMDLFQYRKMRFVDFEPEMVKKIIGELPIYYPRTIPAGTYKGMDKPHNTLGYRAIIIVRKDFPEKLAYEILKQFFDHKEEINAIHPKYKAITLKEATVGMPIPLHPGTVRFLKDKGIKK